MKKLRLYIKRAFVVMLVTSLIMSICVSESFAEEIVDNTENTEKEVADIPADINLVDAEYEINAEAVALDGTTTVTDGGEITYQWYKDGEVLENEDNFKIILDTSVIGEYKYKVIATNTLYDENSNIIATVKKESNEITIKIFNNDKENGDFKKDKNKDDFDKKDTFDNDDKPTPGNVFDKENRPGMDNRSGEGDKLNIGKNMGILGKNILGFNGKMPNMGKFSGQLQNRGNTKLTQTSSKNSTTTTSEEEEDTSYKEKMRS